MSGIITDVQKYQRGWTGGGSETPCGFGSRIDQTQVQRRWIPEMVARYGVKSIADIGAGDLNWMRLVEWPHPLDYYAYDLVPRANGVEPFDLIHEIPPKVDLILCLWLLNHLPEPHAAAALKNLRASGSKYLIYTWWPAMAGFLDLGFIESTILRKNAKGTQFEIRLVTC